MKLKKILASVISVAMMLSTMGFTALAAGEVAFIDDVGFATLQDAIDAVKDSETIKLVATTDETVMVDNGWVKVTLNADHKNFHIKVADSGVGIPDDC